jgi:hypothetical protein
MSALCCGTVTRADTIPYRRSDNASPARIKYRMEIRSGIMFKISISRCVYRRIQPRDASFWANFCGVFYSNDHVANYMQLHMVWFETSRPYNGDEGTDHRSESCRLLLADPWRRRHYVLAAPSAKGEMAAELSQ